MKKNYIKPVNDVTNKILNSDSKTVFLLGEEGSGKTTVLNELATSQETPEKMFVVYEPNFAKLNSICGVRSYRLYQTALVLKHVVLDIQKKYPLNISFGFRKIYFVLDNIINRIELMYIVGATDDAYEHYLKEFSDFTPEIIFEMFLNYTQQFLPDVDITIILESFDKITRNYPTYQNLIYRLLHNNMNLIVAASDKRVLENPELLKGEGEVVSVNYNKDLENVTSILERVLYISLYDNGVRSFDYQLKNILSESAIERLIEITNGNLSDMILAIEYLGIQIKNFGAVDYEKILFDYVSKELLSNERKDFQKNRTLHII